MEQLLYHIWQNKMFDTSDLRFTDGTPFEIIDYGQRNSDSGPDFFNAKLKIYNTVWAGNIEFHNTSSDWYAHRHNKDKSYDNVILNVITRHDCDVFRTKGDKIAQFVMTIDDKILQDYNFITSLNPEFIACGYRIDEVPRLYLTDWLGTLAVERIITKAQRLKDMVERYHGDWEEALYILLVRNFGTGINNDTFERVARSLPLSVLRKHIDSKLQTEAMLFGQGGFLDEDVDEDSDCSYTLNPYYQLLKREYDLLKVKFRLKPLSRSCWKLFRLRPGSFPQLRLAALSSFLNKHPRFFAAFVEAESPEELKDLFDVELTHFWDNHYCFENTSSELHKSLGTGFFNNIMINTLIPLLFAYGQSRGDERMQERAFDFLEMIPAENNKYVRNWRETGLTVRSALDTQALIQLQKEYCSLKKCFSCRIGCKLLCCRNIPEPHILDDKF